MSYESQREAHQGECRTCERRADAVAALAADRDALLAVARDMYRADTFAHTQEAISRLPAHLQKEVAE